MLSSIRAARTSFRVEKAYTDAVNALEKYESTSKAVVANEEAHRYALEKYASGKSAVYEYNEIKMKLAEALSKQSKQNMHIC